MFTIHELERQLRENNLSKEDKERVEIILKHKEETTRGAIMWAFKEIWGKLE